MIREEEIWNIINKIFPIPSINNKRTFEQELIIAGFEVGAKWADEHPKSTWISVYEDLPCNHSDLVLTYNNISFSTKRVLVMTDIHTLFLCEMKKDNNHGWIWNCSTKDKIVYWFPIPELPKK